MKKLKSLSESSFLKLFFAFISVCFLVAAVCMPDRGTMFTGLWKILSQPAKISTNYFDLGGYAATFLNMGLMGLIMLALFALFRTQVNNVSTLAFLLTLGFSAWGIHILNLWPTVLGVMLYGLVKREKLSGLTNAMLFSTGIAPLISELLVRYPGTEVVGFNLVGVILAIVVGLAIGFFLPAGLAHSPNVHKGFDLYSAAVPVGMTAFLLQGILFKSVGLDTGALPILTKLDVASQLTVNVFCCVVFGLCIVLALLLGCKPRDYWQLLKDSGYGASFSGKYGNAAMLMNVGVYGLFIVLYYNMIGATFNSVTLGVIFCMLACCNSGSHPGNVWPIMAGYMVAATLFGWLSPFVGGEFSQAINAQAIVVGLCYANGLAPIAGKYGWHYGIFAGIFHYCLVTTVPSLHGGFCLYNGGFTAAFVCLLMVPVLERFCKPRADHLAAKAK